MFRCLSGFLWMRIWTEWFPFPDSLEKKFKLLSVSHLNRFKKRVPLLTWKCFSFLFTDSCLRQFPEFGERARKRIRTYLKSCRRNKRSALEMSGLNLNGSSSSLRPMPPHLTSAAAEQILAQACDNENQNAKRLRLGLDPISQPLPVVYLQIK